MADVELAALLPGRDVECKGEAIRVLPLYFGQWPTAIKIVRPIAGALNESKVFGMKQVMEDGKAAIRFEISSDWMASLPMLLDQGGEALMVFFAYCIGKPRTWFDTLDGDQGLKLAHAIFAENQDFFARRILPMLNELGLVKVASEDPAGVSSLPDSEATDTAGVTSST